MIVWQSTYDELEKKYRELQREYSKLDAQNNANIADWNRLVKKINRYGGSDALIAAATGNAELQLAKKDIKKIVSLCHPDKHGGSKIAEEITRKLLALR